MTPSQLVGASRITEVWRLLGGGPLRNRRGQAWWRDGDGWSVSVDDDRGVWYDHRAGVGGGILDLIQQVHGGTRSEAVQWLADATSATLESGTRHSASQLRAQASVRREASYFEAAARAMSEAVLNELSSDDPDRAVLVALQGELSESHEAVYRAWRQCAPRMAAALVFAGRQREGRLQRMLAAFLLRLGDAAA